MNDPYLFSGTAEYYRRFRVPYPEVLLSRLCSKAGLSGHGRLLDLGCGTGEIAVPLAPWFAEVVGVDVEPEMLQEAAKRAVAAGCSNIHWYQGSAMDYVAPQQSFELITIGSAFHWMDRALLARRCQDWLVPGQPLAILGSNSTWTGTAQWQGIARTVIRRWLGEARRAGSGNFGTSERRHEVVLADEGFETEEFHKLVYYTWELNSFIGYLFSTSFASREVLGDMAQEFEADMRRTLLEHDSSGCYREKIVFYCILGRTSASLSRMSV